MSHVPGYVYLLFIILMYLGYKRCFTRTISWRRLLILPILFLFLSLHSMVSLFQLTGIEVVFGLLGGILGLGLGFLHVKNKIIQADRRLALITIPGDWTMLLLILGIFIFEFFIHYIIESHSSIANDVWFAKLAIAVLGLIAGMAIGRSLSYLYKYQKA